LRRLTQKAVGAAGAAARAAAEAAAGAGGGGATGVAHRTGPPLRDADVLLAVSADGSELVASVARP
jgi:hypothetical protein